MSAIHTINIGGINYDVKATHYATCPTAAATTAKIATIQNGEFALETGVKVSVKFDYANTLDNPVLNINDSGNKDIYFQGSQLTAKNSWNNNQVVDFVYDGSCWHVIGLSSSNTLFWNNF